MKLSFTYYIVLLVLKLKGIKKNFSKDPVDFKKIRKDDIFYPKSNLFKKCKVNNFTVLNTSITEIQQKSTTKNLLIFIHGGAFISGPAKHHWDSIKTITNQINHTVWMCNYPKAPENKITEISKNIDAIYSKALEKYGAKQVTFIGDSVGGTLIIALTQRLIQKNIKLPFQIILISPVMDATMSNSEIDQIDKIDPMLSKLGVLSAKKMCIENEDLKNEMISPINGSFDKFPNTMLFLAENDITYPDQELALKKLIKANVNVEVIIGKKMPHIWPLLPIMKESKLALKQIINRLNKEGSI